MWGLQATAQVLQTTVVRLRATKKGDVFTSPFFVRYLIKSLPLPSVVKQLLRFRFVVTYVNYPFKFVAYYPCKVVGVAHTHCKLGLWGVVFLWLKVGFNYLFVHLHTIKVVGILSFPFVAPPVTKGKVSLLLPQAVGSAAT